MTYEVPKNAFKTSIPDDRTAIPFDHLEFQTPNDYQEYVKQCLHLKNTNVARYLENIYRNINKPIFHHLITDHYDHLVRMLPKPLSELVATYRKCPGTYDVTLFQWAKACGCQLNYGNSYDILNWTLYDLLAAYHITPSLSNMISCLMTLVKMEVYNDR